ncbi:MAG: HAD family hydrolase [Pyrinomonadaceae bacterium]
MIQAVIFDLDGVLIDSEQVWDDVREDFTCARGGEWSEQAQRDMMGMSSTEWSRYMAQELGVPLSPEEINDAVVEEMATRYRERLPLIEGAVEAVQRMAAEWPLGLASSANRPLIDLVLELSGLDGHFAVTMSSEEVERGKPAPDVYLAVAERMSVAPSACAAIEDSSNGLRSAHAAGMRVVAIPNAHFRPEEDALALADVVLESLAELAPEPIARD